MMKKRHEQYTNELTESNDHKNKEYREKIKEINNNYENIVNKYLTYYEDNKKRIIDNESKSLILLKCQKAIIKVK